MSSGSKSTLAPAIVGTNLGDRQCGVALVAQGQGEAPGLSRRDDAKVQRAKVGPQRGRGSVAGRVERVHRVPLRDEQPARDGIQRERPGANPAGRRRPAARHPAGVAPPRETRIATSSKSATTAWSATILDGHRRSRGGPLALPASAKRGRTRRSTTRPRGWRPRGRRRPAATSRAGSSGVEATSDAPASSSAKVRTPARASATCTKPSVTATRPRIRRCVREPPHDGELIVEIELRPSAGSRRDPQVSAGRSSRTPQGCRSSTSRLRRCRDPRRSGGPSRRCRSRAPPTSRRLPRRDTARPTPRPAPAPRWTDPTSPGPRRRRTSSRGAPCTAIESQPASGAHGVASGPSQAIVDAELFAVGGLGEVDVLCPGHGAVVRRRRVGRARPTPSGGPRPSFAALVA